MQLNNLIKAAPAAELGCSRRETPALSLCSLCSVLFCSPATALRPAPPPISGRHARTQLVERSQKEKMEVEMQLDDDVFFAELSKRISLLITDDDEADFAAAQFPAAALQLPPGFSMAPHVPQGQGASMLAPPAYTLFHHAASYGAANSAGDAARAWQPPQQQCGSKGTGVFIPRSTPGSAHSKRKGRNWSGSKAHKARAQAEGVLAAGTPVKRRA